MEFTYPADLWFECNGCGLCCGDTQRKTRHILLLSSEAERIAMQTNQAVADFAVARDARDAKDLYIYEMKKTDGKCVFLKGNRCVIYSSRPLVCICYPFELRFDARKKVYSFDFTVECPTIGKGKQLNKTYFQKLFVAAQERLC